jgi:hypothetical protein
MYGDREPYAAICNSFSFDSQGKIVDGVTPDEIARQVRANPKDAEYSRIKAPALGIYYVWTLETRLPQYWYMTPAQQAEYDIAWGPLVKWQADAIQRFRQGVDNSRVIALHDSNHYIYLNDEGEVARLMREFLTLPLSETE